MCRSAGPSTWPPSHRSARLSSVATRRWARPHPASLSTSRKLRSRPRSWSAARPFPSSSTCGLRGAVRASNCRRFSRRSRPNTPGDSSWPRSMSMLSSASRPRSRCSRSRACSPCWPASPYPCSRAPCRSPRSARTSMNCCEWLPRTASPGRWPIRRQLRRRRSMSPASRRRPRIRASAPPTTRSRRATGPRLLRPTAPSLRERRTMSMPSQAWRSARSRSASTRASRPGPCAMPTSRQPRGTGPLPLPPYWPR